MPERMGGAPHDDERTSRTRNSYMYTHAPLLQLHVLDPVPSRVCAGRQLGTRTDTASSGGPCVVREYVVREYEPN